MLRFIQCALLGAFAFVLLVLTAIPVGCDGAMLGIDLGSQFIKTVIIKPGSPFTIVHDEATKRKSPAIIGFDKNMRKFGTSAQSMSIMNSDKAFLWMHRLLGKPFNCPQQLDFVSAGFPYQFIETARGTIALSLGDDQVFTVEELVAMNLQSIQQNAFVDHQVVAKDVVITVPVFFSQKEREAVVNAAAIAGLNLIALINDNTAAAINYGYSRSYNVSEVRNTCFFNMGASYTSVSVVQYSGYHIKNGLSNQTVGQVDVKGVAWDESLGGQAFDLRLVNFLATKFQDQLKKNGMNDDIRTVPRAMAKLRDNSQKTKEIMSANPEFPVRIENLYNDLDFYHLITRDDFLDITADILDRIAPVVSKALKNSGLDASQINEFVIIGGSSRIPKVQELLKSVLSRQELDQNLNADEGFAFGAAFVAANNSLAFRVRKFGANEIIQLPVGVRIYDVVPTEPAWSKRASLFSKYAKIPSKRHVNIARENDITVELQYDDPENLPLGTSSSIAMYSVTGITEAFKQYKELGDPKVQLTFEVSANGIVELTSGEISVQETVQEPIPTKKSSKTDLPKTDDEENKQDDSPDVPQFRSVVKTRRTPLTIEKGSSGNVQLLSPDMFQASVNVLKKIAARDQLTKDTALSRNRLESHIYETRSSMSDPKVIDVSLESMRTEIITALDEALEWLYDHDDRDDSPALYNDKRETLSEMSDDIFLRVREQQSRTAAVNQCVSAIEEAELFIAKMRESMPWISNSSIDSLEQIKNTTSLWFKEQIDAQKEKAPHENPVVLSVDLNARASTLKKRVAQLLRIPKPIPKPEPKKKKSTKTSTAEKQASSKLSEDSAPGPPENDALDGEGFEPEVSAEPATFKETEGPIPEDTSEKPEL